MNKDSIPLWKQRIENRKASGLKVDEWCEQNQLSRHAYYYWHRKIKDTAEERKSVSVFAEVPSKTRVSDLIHDNKSIGEYRQQFCTSAGNSEWV